MYFLLTFLLFLLIKAFQWYLGVKNKPNREKVDSVKKELIQIIEPLEKELGITKAPIHHLRIASVFYKLEGQKEKESLRKKMMELVDESKAKPMRNIYLFVLFILMQVTAIYIIYLFLYTEPSQFLAIVLLVLTAYFWIRSKRYILGVLFLIIGLLLYFRISSTVVFFLILNMSYTIIMNTYKSRIKEK